MTRIGLLSDTHGWLDPRIFHHFDGCDEVWHAGDIGNEEVLQRLKNFKPLRAVFGNIDGTDLRTVCNENERFWCEGVDTWITHIGGKPGNYALPVRKELQSAAPKLFVCGHSHICMVQMDKANSMLYINPGAAGTHGFHKMRTILRFEIEGDKIQNMQVIELGERAKTNPEKIM